MYKTVETRGAFGSALFALRRNNGLSAEAFAKKINVGRNTVWRWENGKSLPNPEAYNKIYVFFSLKCFDDTSALQDSYAYSLTHPYIKKEN